MKKKNRIISLFLCLVLVFSVCPVTAMAEDSVSLSFLNYNVSGLPDFKGLLGQGGTDVEANQALIGKKINEAGYDIVAVQEDFGYHDTLLSGMTNYAYKTATSGMVPGGDGLNVITENSAIYDAERTEWNTSYGGISEGDTLTPKGVLYTVLDLGNGIYLDFYNLHADAFDGDGSALARADQYRQLMDMVNTRSADRPVIITGDFNTSLWIENPGDDAADEIAMRNVIVEENGFQDAWIELKNNGNYDDFTSWINSGVSYWGNWDSVEKFFYRSGGGVEITAEDFSYVRFTDENGTGLSDHSAAYCLFTFTKTASFTEDTRTHSVTKLSGIAVFLNTVKWIFKDIIYILSNFDELKSYISG